MPSFRQVKKAWGPGPWQDEPDGVQWIEPESGFDCTIRRSWGLGMWCGYVGVPPGHPAYGLDYQAVHDRWPDLEVHGGLTYRAAEADAGFLSEQRDVWWFGFDCAHAWDLVPSAKSRNSRLGLPDWEHPEAVYRDLAYVTAETERLARQLGEMANVT